MTSAALQNFSRRFHQISDSFAFSCAFYNKVCNIRNGFRIVKFHTFFFRPSAICGAVQITIFSISLGANINFSITSFYKIELKYLSVEVLRAIILENISSTAVQWMRII